MLVNGEMKNKKTEKKNKKFVRLNKQGQVINIK